MQIQCPRFDCEHIFFVRDSQLGKENKCPKCDTVFTAYTPARTQSSTLPSEEKASSAGAKEPSARLEQNILSRVESLRNSKESPEQLTKSIGALGGLLAALSDSGVPISFQTIKAVVELYSGVVKNCRLSGVATPAELIIGLSQFIALYLSPEVKNMSGKEQFQRIQYVCDAGGDVVLNDLVKGMTNESVSSRKDELVKVFRGSIGATNEAHQRIAQSNLSNTETENANLRLDNLKNVFSHGLKTTESGSCFIATATYGSPQAPEIEILRQFRDEVLLRSKGGQIFVDLYYLISPPIAHAISQSIALKKIVRNCLLEPLIKIVSQHIDDCACKKVGESALHKTNFEKNSFSL